MSSGYRLWARPHSSYKYFPTRPRKDLAEIWLREHLRLAEENEANFWRFCLGISGRLVSVRIWQTVKIWSIGFFAALPVFFLVTSDFLASVRILWEGMAFLGSSVTGRWTLRLDPRFYFRGMQRRMISLSKKRAFTVFGILMSWNTQTETPEVRFVLLGQS